ncbi:hypothetical protein GP486_003586 [Trichoglossum hirsutum]|uniref:DUF7580 domain-containing protein n=1 Tax=Trichoglossum hirsutum TaxID=265104 RepID=A0A9P8LCM9_9PEZI|nr:hypothetical protein GP486_003586 [Trichoglossum hirsutum]
MVTGVEVAGLILGSIPLLISAAEHRDVGLAPLNTLLFGRSQSQKLAIVLEEEQISFRHCCGRLLSIAEVENIADLLSEKVGKTELQRLWASPSLKARLQSEFGDDFRVIEARLIEIQELINKLDKYLGSKIFHRAAWSRSQSKDVELLRSKTERLKRLLDGEHLSMAVGSIGDTWRAEIIRTKEIRQHFIDIHACIDSSWGCQCSSDHAINFQYEEVNHNGFTVLFAPSAYAPGSPKTPKATWALQPLRITIPKEQSSTQIQPFTGLCGSLQQTLNTGLVTVTGGASKLQYCLQKADNATATQALIPLGHLLPPASGLSKHTVPTGRPKDRIILGARLINAVLQHHSTRWLPQDWGTQNVFLRPGSAYSPMPYFEACFSQPAAGKVQKPWKPPCVRNLTLHNLAIVLIELAHNDSLDHLMNDEERNILRQPIGSQYARVQAASRLVEELPDHLIPDTYCQVVRMCLSGEFGVPLKGKELSDDDLFSAVYRMAAKPLMDSLSIK